MYNTCKYTMSRQSYSKRYQTVRNSNDEASYNLWHSGFGDLVSSPENDGFSSKSLSSNIGVMETKQKTYVVLPCGSVIQSTNSSPPPIRRFGKVFETIDESCASRSLTELNQDDTSNLSSMKLLAYKPLETGALVASERENRSNVYFSKASFDIAVGKARKQSWLEMVDNLSPRQRFARAIDFFKRTTTGTDRKNHLARVGGPKKIYHQFNTLRDEEELALTANHETEFEDDVVEKTSKPSIERWRNKWMRKVGTRARRFYRNVKNSLDHQGEKKGNCCCGYRRTTSRDTFIN